jgi:hypothetical protein
MAYGRVHVYIPTGVIPPEQKTEKIGLVTASAADVMRERFDYRGRIQAGYAALSGQIWMQLERTGEIEHIQDPEISDILIKHFRNPEA